MVTLLSVVNDVMAKLERAPVDTVDRNPASKLAARNVAFSIRAIASTNSNWPWLIGEYTAESWVQEVATLPGALLHLHYIFDKGSLRQIDYVEDLVFNQRALTSYTGAIGGARWWTIKNTNSVRLNPYPADADAKNNIVFKAAILLPTPVQDNDEIQIPERDINMLVYRVMSMMALDHLKDATLSQSYMTEYMRASQEAKQRMSTDSVDKRNSMIR